MYRDPSAYFRDEIVLAVRFMLDEEGKAVDQNPEIDNAERPARSLCIDKPSESDHAVK
jgi:hypothetical protein